MAGANFFSEENNSLTEIDYLDFKEGIKNASQAKEKEAIEETVKKRKRTKKESVSDEYMRTEVRLPKSLHMKVKMAAMVNGQTMVEFIEESLKKAVKENEARCRAYFDR